MEGTCVLYYITVESIHCFPITRDMDDNYKGFPYKLLACNDGGG